MLEALRNLRIAQRPLFAASTRGVYLIQTPGFDISSEPYEGSLQESELVTLLKKLPLGQSELCILRERAVQLKEGTLKSRGEALLPLMLSSFIFDSLVLAQQPGSSRDTSRYLSLIHI